MTKTFDYQHTSHFFKNTPKYGTLFCLFKIFSYFWNQKLLLQSLNLLNMKPRYILITLACLFAGIANAQTNLSTDRNQIYVEFPILSKGENSQDQSTFASMRPFLMKKVNDNPKVIAVENKNCPNKLLTVIQNYKQFISRDSTSGKRYYKIEFFYTLAIKNTEKGEVLAQAMSKKGYAQSETSYADALANACKTIPYQSDINEVVEESFALVGLITKVEPDAKKPSRAGKVYIDLGKNHGLRKNQWFDVFIVNNGNVSDRIATLQLDEAEANSALCKVKKGKDTLLSVWNARSSSAKIVVVSRMESNIFKKMERALDFGINIINAY